MTDRWMPWISEESENRYRDVQFFIKEHGTKRWKTKVGPYWILNKTSMIHLKGQCFRISMLDGKMENLGRIEEN